MFYHHLLRRVLDPFVFSLPLVVFLSWIFVQLGMVILAVIFQDSRHDFMLFTEFNVRVFLPFSFFQFAFPSPCRVASSY